VLLPLAALLHIGATSLKKYGQGGELNVPRILTLLPFPPRVPKEPEERKISSR
jgi:hypothetical protein